MLFFSVFQVLRARNISIGSLIAQHHNIQEYLHSVYMHNSLRTCTQYFIHRAVPVNRLVKFSLRDVAVDYQMHPSDVMSIINRYFFKYYHQAMVKQSFDASCRRAYDAKQTAYRAWCRHAVDNWGQFVLARVETEGVYGSARESHNEQTRNTLKHSANLCT